MVKKEFIQHRERLILKSNPVAKRSVQPGMVATDRITRVEMGAGQLEYYRKHPSLSILFFLSIGHAGIWLRLLKHGNV